MIALFASNSCVLLEKNICLLLLFFEAADPIGNLIAQLSQFNIRLSLLTEHFANQSMQPIIFSHCNPPSKI
jgi:microsomal dipeptidase-like Zn-dependent dipeptidase